MGFENLSWVASGIVPATDATGESDYGTLDRFVEEGKLWRLACDVGVIEVVGGTLSISFTNEAHG
jgi:hypothetical protein